LPKITAPKFKLKQCSSVLPKDVPKDVPEDLLEQISQFKNQSGINDSSLIQPKDGMTKDILLKLLDVFIVYNQTVAEMNDLIKTNQIEINTQSLNKPLLKDNYIRCANFPSEISENIVKFVLLKVYGIWPNWNVKGDLKIEELGLILEVKARSSQNPSPTSFGPNEKWHILFFLDASDYSHKNFKVYEIYLPHNHPKFASLMVNETQTYTDQCEAGRRPRFLFEKIRDHLPVEFCREIYSGHINDIFS
jgi:hypothetical protein